MVKYFVLDPNGQKYGPADVNMLNQWIAEGRLTADTMLEDADSKIQTRASGVPTLRFSAPGAPPQQIANAASPVVPSLNANPYDTPRPGAGPQPFNTGYQRPYQQPANVGGQVGLAWLFTVIAPVTIYFLWFGLFIAIYGIRAGASLVSYGLKGQGIAIIVLNSCWIVMYVLLRVLFYSGNHAY